MRIVNIPSYFIKMCMFSSAYDDFAFIDAKGRAPEVTRPQWDNKLLKMCI